MRNTLLRIGIAVVSLFPLLLGSYFSWLGYAWPAKFMVDDPDHHWSRVGIIGLYGSSALFAASAIFITTKPSMRTKLAFACLVISISLLLSVRYLLR